MRKVSIFLITLIYGCGQEITQHNREDIIFYHSGMLDSAVVYGCYSYTSRYFVPDTFSLNEYNRVIMQFNSNTNSDGTSVTVFYNNETNQNFNLYSAYNESGINRQHGFEFISPKTQTWFEIRLYINPPVCGKGEFKYVSVGDLRIIGVK